MNESDELFEKIKAKYCSGESGFGWSGASWERFKLVKNNRSIQLTKEPGDTVEVLFSVGNEYSMLQSDRCLVTELVSVIEDWAALGESKEA